MKFHHIVLCAFFALSVTPARATVAVSKGKAKITGILNPQGKDYFIGINVLSRSKHFFKINNPEVMASISGEHRLQLVDVDMQVTKLVDAENSEVTVKSVARSKQKSSPLYSTVGN